MLILKRLLSLVCRRAIGATGISFAFHQENIAGLGEVFLPVVTVGLWLKAAQSWVDFQFIVDSGATATILPAAMAEELGIDLQKHSEVDMAGVEGTGVKSWLAKIKVKIGDESMEIPCFFVDNDRVPFLLGRAGILDGDFSLLIDSHNKKLVFWNNRVS